MSFIWNYKGHEQRLFAKGPNWVQFTFPPSRKRRRCSLIIVYKTAKGDRV